LHLGELILGHHRDVIVNEVVAVHLPAVLIIAITIFQRRAQA
jgi:hypothetical protein